MTISGLVGRDASVQPALVLPAGVRAVVFDVVGTLVEPHPSVALAYQAAAARHGVERDAGEIGRRFHQAWRRQEALDATAASPFVTDRAREQARWRAIVDEVFADCSETPAIFADLWEHFGRPAAWRPTAQGPGLVRQALDAGPAVALASNFDERLHAIAGCVEPLSLVPHVFASSELGWRKPAVEFFRRIEERIDHDPSELMIIGDDPELDIAAGRRAGWHVHPVGRQSP